MKFRIYRTSDYSGELQPHPKAVYAGILDEYKHKEWEIEFNTLEELLDFAAEVDTNMRFDEIIIVHDKRNNTYGIEIYDDFRE